MSEHVFSVSACEKQHVVREHQREPERDGPEDLERQLEENEAEGDLHDRSVT